MDPYQANAPLLVPESTEVVARTPVPDALPFLEESKEVKGVLTTGNVLQKALDHLVEVEPKLKPIIYKHHCGVFDVNGLKEVIDPWVSLTSSIIGQQVSRFGFEVVITHCSCTHVPVTPLHPSLLLVCFVCSVKMPVRRSAARCI